jgi:hypothetical protein
MRLKMLNYAAGDDRPESRGQRVRRLDRLLHLLSKQKEGSSNPRRILNTGDLESLRNEARYCFIDAGGRAQDALQQLDAMDFTKVTVLDKESQKARYDWIDPSSCTVLDADSEKRCIENLERVIELVQGVREIEETGSEIRSAVAASVTPDRSKDPWRFRDLDTLLRLKSVSQSQAAEAFGISSRAIRNLLRNNKLIKTARGRIACDQKFADQFNERHSPLKK